MRRALFRKLCSLPLGSFIRLTIFLPGRYTCRCGPCWLWSLSLCRAISSLTPPSQCSGMLVLLCFCSLEKKNPSATSCFPFTSTLSTYQRYRSVFHRSFIVEDAALFLSKKTKANVVDLRNSEWCSFVQSQDCCVQKLTSREIVVVSCCRLRVRCGSGTASVVAANQ